MTIKSQLAQARAVLSVQSQRSCLSLRAGIPILGHRFEGHRDKRSESCRQESAEGFDGQENARRTGATGPPAAPRRRRRQRLLAATHLKPTWSATGVPRRAIRRSIWRSPKTRNLPGRPRRRVSRPLNLRAIWLRPVTSSSWNLRTRARWLAPSSLWDPTRGNLS